MMSIEAKVMIGFVAFLILFYGPIGLYFKFDWFEGFFHDVMGWHRPDYTHGVWNDGCSNHAKCKHCGKSIMQDSQGNWFTFDGGADNA